jgi:hypothetical protein
MYAKIVTDEKRSGIELLELQGGPCYEEERLTLSNSLSNGLRLQVDDEGCEIAHFHIEDAETAKLIATRLLEWSERIANPPSP